VKRIKFRHIVLQPPSRLADFAPAAHYLLLGLFLLSSIAVALRLYRPGWISADAVWPDGLLVLSAVATTLAALARRLPAQNVVAVAVLIGVMFGGAQYLGARYDIPFGPFTYADAPVRSQNALPWIIPLVWLSILLNARGVARLVLRPWRQTRNYGFWQIGLSTLLVVLMDLGLQPFASKVNSYWTWKPTLLASTWYGAPWVNFLGRGVITLLILAFVTPFLINKRPGKHSIDFHPLLVWTVVNFLFLTSAATHGQTPATAVILAQTLIIAALALAGSRRHTNSPPAST